jgi:hypothetical protein
MRVPKGTDAQIVVCVYFMLMVVMGARDSEIHEIYYPRASGLGIHEVLSS